MNQVVRWQNNFIQSVYSLNLTEKKLMLGIALSLQNHGEFRSSVTFDMKQIEAITGLSEESHKSVKLAVHQLMQKIITVEDPLKPRNWQKFQMLGPSKMENGILKLTIHKEMEPFLFDLADYYTAYHLENIRPLGSSYSIRIYELLKMHEKQKNKQCEYTIEELRSMMGITTEYGRYNDFKRYVLEQAKKDLKEKTDVKFTYKEEKLGRSVNKIIFTIKENSEEKDSRNKAREAKKRQKTMEQSQTTLDELVQFSLEEKRDFAEKIAKKAKGEETEEPEIIKKLNTDLTEEKTEDRRKYEDIIVPTGKRQIDKDWRKKRGIHIPNLT